MELSTPRGGIWQVTDPTGRLVDIAGFEVLGSDDQALGTVHEASFDLADPAWFVLDRPGPGRKVLVPVRVIETIVAADRSLRLLIDADYLDGAPAYRPGDDWDRSSRDAGGYYGLLGALAVRRNA